MIEPPAKEVVTTPAKKPKIDQIPTANLDADDSLDDAIMCLSKSKKWKWKQVVDIVEMWSLVDYVQPPAMPIAPMQAADMYSRVLFLFWVHGKDHNVWNKSTNMLTSSGALAVSSKWKQDSEVHICCSR